MAAERGGAEPSASSQSPIASSASIRFATSRVLSIPYRRITSSAGLPQSRRLAGPAQHRQRVGEVDVRAFQAQVIADLLGEPQGLAKMGETLLAAAEVGEVGAEHGERPDLCLARADLPGERERLLADRQRLGVAPGHHQPARQRAQRVRALGRGRLRRHELDRALERGEAGVVPADLVQVLAEAHMQERRAVRVVGADELDRPPGELDRARRGTDLAGELGRPGAELGEVEPGELGRVRHGVPQRERPFEVREGLGQAEDRLGLACRLDRRGQRLARCDPRPPSAARAPPAPRLPLRASSSASRACSSSRSPGRIVA